MKTINSIIGLSVFLLGAGGCKNQNQAEQNKTEDTGKKQMNVLFIAVDDLRPELGCYGNDLIHSPNIDKLAAQSVMFNRSYCNIPVSGASRTSLLTGTRPTRNTLMTAHHDAIDNKRPNVPTIPGYFRKHGYYNIRNGKITHHTWEDTASWNEVWYPKTNHGFWRDYILAKNWKFENPNDGLPYECVNVSDTGYMDGKTALKTVNDLKRLKDRNQPFFLGVGFYKPHLPFTAPKKYWDLYNPDDIFLPKNTYKPENAPDIAMHNWGELRKYGGIPPQGPLTDDAALNLKHGYYACVSYIDAQVGKVLNALDSLGLRENTVVVLWGDHGWNLREHGLWCKHCNFHTSLHAPLIVSAPGMSKGKKTESITEFVDVYPSLCELAGIPVPEHAEGNSFVNVLKNPSAEIDGLAVCRWGEGWTVIKDQYYYTEWFDENDSVYARMLYDHNNDPDENVNIAVNEENKKLIEKLSAILHDNLGDKFDN